MVLKTLNWISRILFGSVFIIAGFTKAIDPLGSAYKFEDYFLALGMERLFPLALPMAILLNSLELLVGIAILIGLKMRSSAWAGLLFMAFFTPLTLYIAITDPVPDCGCFGDAIIISNWETFYKNIIFLAAAILIFTQRHKVRPLWSSKKDWYLVGGVSVLIVWLSFYCFLNLPIIDFRPWKVGNDINEQLMPVQVGIAEYSFVYKNSVTSESNTFDANNLPINDTTWVFVDRKELVIQEHIPSPIDNFVVYDEYGNDITHVIIGNPSYQFLGVSYDLNRTNNKAFKNKLNQIASNAKADGFGLIVVTNSTLNDIEDFANKHNASYPFYQSDERELKTIIRSNPGLVLLKDGVVIKKWHHRNIPDYNYIKNKHMSALN